jgi:hypothetical protein
MSQPGQLAASGPSASQFRTGGGQGGHHVGPDLALEDALSGEMRLALQDSLEAAKACEWCADRCIDEGPGMARCIRLCRDVVELATVSAAFIARDSIFGPEVAETFAAAAEECALECEQHPHEHCQACARVLRRAVRSTRALLAAGGGMEAVQQEPVASLPAGSQ